MTNKMEIPIWFWIVSVIALLWNLMGLFAFYSDMTISSDALAAMTADQRGLYETQPLWAKAVFGGAVILGVLGSIGLLIKKKWASQLLLLSLACVLGQMAHAFMSNSYEIMGGNSMIMGIVVLVFALFLVWFSRMALVRGLLN